jgi:DNA polymerase
MILVLGKVAAIALFSRTDSLASFRQSIHYLAGIPTVVTYHPAALLRNPQWKRPVWDDVRMLRDKFDHLVKLTS